MSGAHERMRKPRRVLAVIGGVAFILLIGIVIGIWLTYFVWPWPATT